MAIIVSKKGGIAVKLNRTPFGLEDKIQQTIYDIPESIPLYDIKDDVKLLVLAREFTTKSGPIDAIGIDKDGDIYIVETKLYKNPDKRTVLAQVLDYGASLWKAHPEFDSFLLRIESSVQEKFHMTLREKIQEFFSSPEMEFDDTEVETLIANMRENLDEGNFKFVVLMDTIHDQLKDLILYMNKNSMFDIYGVELEYYKYDEFEIIIPKLFGTEVKKDLSKKINVTPISQEEIRKLWIERHCEESLQIAEQEFVDLVKEIDNDYELYYKMSHLRVTKNGQQNNYISLVPQSNALLLFIKIPLSEKMESSVRKAFEHANYRLEKRDYKLRIEKGMISQNKDLLKDMLTQALER